MSNGKTQSAVESMSGKSSTIPTILPTITKQQQQQNKNSKISIDNKKTEIGSMTSYNTNPEHILDRFGFILNLDSQGNVIDHEQEDANRLRALERRPADEEITRIEGRKKKWNVMLTKWSPSFWQSVRTQKHKTIEGDDLQQLLYNKLKGRKYAILLRRVRKGIPDSERSVVWPVICNVATKIKENPGLYDQLVKESVVRMTATPTAPKSDDMNANGNGTPFDSTTTTTNVTTNGAKTALVIDTSDQQLDGLATPTSDSDYYTPTKHIQQTFNHTKSFRNIQDTIERDIHRTFPRHSMFCDDICPMESDDECYRVSNDASSSAATSDQDENDTSGNIYLKDATTEKNGGIQLSRKDENGCSDTCDNMEDSNSSSQSLRLPRVRSLEIKTSIHDLMIDEEREPKVELFVDSTSDTPMNGGHTTPLKSTGTTSHLTSSNPHRGDNSEMITPDLVLQGRGGQAAMRRVLKAYSTYDKEVGYCQGMNFITGMFLTFMSEEEAFWVLVAVMFERPCKMRGLFGEGMKETHKVLYVAEKLIHQFLPKLAKHLDTESIHVTMFATQWLLTVYTSSFKFDLVTRVWDCFLVEGWKVTYRVMLSLLQYHQSALLSLTFEEILAFIREISDKTDGAIIVDEAMKIPLRWSHILKYENEWNSQQR